MENNAELEIKVQSGDIILFSRPCSQMDVVSSFICYSAKFFGWTEWDHLGLVVQNPENGDFYLLEANMNGITCHPLQERLQRSKSQKFAVRQLTIIASSSTNNNDTHNNEARPAPQSESDIYERFRSDLWRISQRYLNPRNKYNTSLLQMTDALISSYSHSFNPNNSVLGLKHELLVVKEDQFLLWSEEKRGGKEREGEGESFSLLHRAIAKAREQLKQTTQKLEEDIKTVDSKSSSFDAAPGDGLSDKAADPRSEEFYCSQLVAEIFLEMKILSNHRYSHQYIPADFSSSTLIKGFVTHSYDSLVVDDDSTSSISREKKKSHKYLYSPDILIPDKQTLSFLSKEGSGVLSLVFPIFPSSPKSGAVKSSSMIMTLPNIIMKKNNNNNSKSNNAIYSIPFHTCDLLPLSTLKSFLDKSEFCEVKAVGDIRVYRRAKKEIIATSNNNHTDIDKQGFDEREEYELIAILNQQTSHKLNLFQFLKSLLLEEETDVFLSAAHSSSLEISPPSTNTNTKTISSASSSEPLLYDGKTRRIVCQAEAVQRLFAKIVSNSQPSFSSSSISGDLIFHQIRDLLLDQIRPQSSFEDESGLESDLERFRALCGNEIVDAVSYSYSSSSSSSSLKRSSGEEGKEKVAERYRRLLLLLLSLFFFFQEASSASNSQSFELLTAAVDYHLDSSVLSSQQRADLKDRLRSEFGQSSKSIVSSEEENDWEKRQVLLPFSALSALSLHAFRGKKSLLRAKIAAAVPWRRMSLQWLKVAMSYRIRGGGKYRAAVGLMCVAVAAMSGVSAVRKRSHFT